MATGTARFRRRIAAVVLAMTLDTGVINGARSSTVSVTLPMDDGIEDSARGGVMVATARQSPVATPFLDDPPCRCACLVVTVPRTFGQLELGKCVPLHEPAKGPVSAIRAGIVLVDPLGKLHIPWLTVGNHHQRGRHAMQHIGRPFLGQGGCDSRYILGLVVLVQELDAVFPQG